MISETTQTVITNWSHDSMPNLLSMITASRALARQWRPRCLGTSEQNSFVGFCGFEISVSVDDVQRCGRVPLVCDGVPFLGVPGRQFQVSRHIIRLISDRG